MSAQQAGRIYKAALYLRLSKDDEGAEESQSIKTQRDILQEYAKRQGLTVVDEYSDDGYSGTNFDRPAFQRMLADIETGRINCVLTKDFSRLGRNSARGLDYMDEYFPAHNVRYISVTDGYDSLHLTDGISVAAPMMMFVNLFADPLEMTGMIDRLAPLCIASYPFAYVLGYCMGPSVNRKQEKENRRAKKLAVRKAQKKGLAAELTGSQMQVHYGHKADSGKHKKKELV